MQRTTDMTKGGAIGHLLRFAFPLIITNLGQQFYMIADAAIVGRGVSVGALAAVGATDWICWMYLWAVAGFTQGFSTFISRYFGEKNMRSLNKAVFLSAVLCVFIGVLLTAVGLLTARPLLLLLGTPADILSGAQTYLLTILSGTLAVTAYNMAASILRAFGDGKSPLIAMIVAGVLNIGLDLLFVLVFRWGIFGAAIASILAQSVSFVYCLFRIRKIEYIHIDRECMKLDFKMIKDMLLFSLPLAFEYIVISLGGIILQSSVNEQGSIFLAGYTATNKIYGLLESSSISIGLACCTFLSQNYGAGNTARVKRGVLAGSAVVAVFAAVTSGLAFLLRYPLLSLFLDRNEEGGPEALEIGVHYLNYLVLFLLVLYLIHIFRNALQAMEISIWSFISGMAECVVRIVMGKIVINYMGRDALFAAEPIAWLAALALVILPYFYYRKKLLNHQGEQKNV